MAKLPHPSQPRSSGFAPWLTAAAPAPVPAADAGGPVGELPGLLQASAHGDRQAFERLYRLTSGRLLAIIRRSVWHPGEAEEVLQELYVRIWHHAKDYDAARAQPLAWLGRIARNLAVDHLRRHASRAAHEQVEARSSGTESDDCAWHCDSAADPALGPPDRLDARQLSAQSLALLADLNPGQRCALLLTFWEGLSQSEVAERLGLPLGTAKSTLRRSLMALKAAHERRAVLDASSAARARHAAAEQPAGSRAVASPSLSWAAAG